MPNWGWLIVILIVVDVAVVTVWLLTRRKTAPANPYNPAFVRNLDVETRGRIERLVADHQHTHALRLLRDRTDLGLADAKAAIDAVARGEWVPTAAPDNAPPTSGWADLVPRLRDLKESGHPDRAVRLLREHTGMSVGEAETTVSGL